MDKLYTDCYNALGYDVSQSEAILKRLSSKRSKFYPRQSPELESLNKYLREYNNLRNQLLQAVNTDITKTNQILNGITPSSRFEFSLYVKKYQMAFNKLQSRSQRHADILAEIADIVHEEKRELKLSDYYRRIFNCLKGKIFNEANTKVIDDDYRLSILEELKADIDNTISLDDIQNKIIQLQSHIDE